LACHVLPTVLLTETIFTFNCTQSAATLAGMLAHTDFHPLF